MGLLGTTEITAERTLVGVLSGVGVSKSEIAGDSNWWRGQSRVTFVR